MKKPLYPFLGHIMSYRQQCCLSLIEVIVTRWASLDMEPSLWMTKGWQRSLESTERTFWWSKQSNLTLGCREELKLLQCEPEIPITRDYWTPNADELFCWQKNLKLLQEGIWRKMSYLCRTFWFSPALQSIHAASSQTQKETGQKWFKGLNKAREFFVFTRASESTASTWVESMQYNYPQTD
jgi:hypothetical protein